MAVTDPLAFQEGSELGVNLRAPAGPHVVERLSDRLRQTGHQLDPGKLRPEVRPRVAVPVDHVLRPLAARLRSSKQATIR